MAWRRRRGGARRASPASARRRSQRGIEGIQSVCLKMSLAAAGVRTASSEDGGQSLRFSMSRFGQSGPPAGHSPRGLSPRMTVLAAGGVVVTTD